MPLVLITGPPCSGKTTFAHALRLALEKYKENTANDVSFCKTLHIVNEESELPAQSKFQSYETSFQEKSTRAAIKSAVSHKVGAESLVIADSTNYIKGFRYELYCVSRMYRSPHCVVWVEAREDVADSWNSAREGALPSSLMAELRQRFEAPNEKNRWDYPLFRVDMTPRDVLKTVNTSTSDSAEGQSSSTTSGATTLVSPGVTKSAWKPKAKKQDKSVSKGDESLSGVGGGAAKPSASFEDSALSSLSGLAISADQSSTIFTLNSLASHNNGASVSASASRSDVKADGTGVWFSGTNIKNEYSSQGESVDIVIEKIIAYFQNTTAAAPHASTLNVTHSSADMLYELDRTSKEILDKIISHQNIIGQEGTPLIFTEFNRSFTSQRHIGAVELQRHRRQFVKVNSSHPPGSVVDIGASFIDFLATQI